MSKWVLFYDSADDVLAKAQVHFPAHFARLQEFHGRGELLAAHGESRLQVSAGLHSSH